MDGKLLRNMVELSNNSLLTGQAAAALSKIEPADLEILNRWMEHAIREQRIKIENASKKARFR
jgi:hypothetical protein